MGGFGCGEGGGVCAWGQGTEICVPGIRPEYVLHTKWGSRAYGMWGEFPTGHINRLIHKVCE